MADGNFRPEFNSAKDCPDVRWRIASNRAGCEFTTALFFPGDTLWFARERDCELAIRNLHEAGIHTVEQFEAAYLEDLQEIIFSDLQW